MSHFTVLVIGPDPEDQLQPYHEYECTGIKDEYVVFVENEDYEKDELTGKRGHWTNPNAKWDWYVLGGRWAGYFTLKPGRFGTQGHHRAKDFAKITGQVVEEIPKIKVDQCVKGDIDIDRMRLEVKVDALAQYQKFIDDLKGEPLPPKWSEFRDRYKNVEQARTEYNQIPGVRNLRRYWDIDHFIKTEDEFVNAAVDSVLVPFAVVKDSKWYERGQMGWFGMAVNEKDKEVWCREFSKLFNSLSDDTILSLYDCHI